MTTGQIEHSVMIPNPAIPSLFLPSAVAMPTPRDRRSGAVTVPVVRRNTRNWNRSRNSEIGATP
jgi:hypothetical protein